MDWQKCKDRIKLMTKEEIEIIEEAMKEKRRVSMNLTKDELRIIEIALTVDIQEQEKFLENIRRDESLEEYFRETKLLREKINGYLTKK